ncbi:MAG: hypothetical protein K6A42_08285 [Treponema sp.]|nr:hypothetical protein [Treponema sp.]
MKKIAILAAAAAFALLASCSNDSGAAPGFYAGGMTTTQTGTTGTAGDSSGTAGTRGASSLYNGKLTIKNFSKYSSIGAASSKDGFNANVAAEFSASVSANASADSGESARLVGQDSNGNVETISVESDGKDSEINERPLQFFRAFKRFVFFMYWPDQTEYYRYSPYGNLSNYPTMFKTCTYASITGEESWIYEPMLVLDKSNGKIYAIDNSGYADNSSDVSNKWQAFDSSHGGYVAEAGDRFYICYSSYTSNKSCVNYYMLKLTDDQLHESYIVKDADSGTFNGMYVDRFGNLFVNGSNSAIKYRIGFDGSKTRINCADNLYVYSSDRPFDDYVHYCSDGTFYQFYSGSENRIWYYGRDSHRSEDDYLDARAPALHTPLFLAANGYVYQASKDSSSRTEVYKRYNANGQLEDCDWVPSASQEYYFTSDELVKEDGSVKYYFSNGSSSNFYYYGHKTVENLQLYNSSGQPATVKKYDFDSRRFTDERIPVVLKSYDVETNYDTNKKSNTIYKVQFADSSENKYTVTEIPLENYNSSSSYSYYYGCNSCAVTKKHIFYIQDNEIVAYNIEDGKKDAACCKSDALYGSICAGDNSDKVSFTATSLSSNASISGTIDDNGLVEQNTTNYEIKYLSPIN